MVAVTKDLSVLSDISPESQDPAADAILLAREQGEIPDVAFWSMEDHLVAIAERNARWLELAKKANEKMEG